MKDQHWKLFQNLNLCHILKWQTSEFLGMFSSWKFTEVRSNLSANYFFMKENRNSSLLITSIFAALFSKKCAEILSALLVGKRYEKWDAIYCKGKSPGVPFHGITSQYSYFKKSEFLRPFSKAAEKTQSCFALDTEQWN